MAAASCTVWDSVLELTKSAQVKHCDPQLWAIQLSSNLNSAGVDLPSMELAHLLVSHICFDNHMPITWKFLDKALSFNLVPPLLVLALLSTRQAITFIDIISILCQKGLFYFIFIYLQGCSESTAPPVCI
jgi:hypothetical protein